jgi:hypothetical protein
MPGWSNANLDDLAATFFREFSRTEYALKAAGYLTTGSGDDARADWDRFAREIGEAIVRSHDPRVHAAVRYILAYPPKKQVVENGQLTWRESRLQNESDGWRLLVFLRRIRNNTFHGGKFNGRWFQPERSQELIIHGIQVLRACRDMEQRVRDAYEAS